ncbi:MAG: hypothetical protein Q8N53_04920 [Longimicrobiales bacterium]|nr:hypothetical protein [Longimicrobiales bacterium]
MRRSVLVRSAVLVAVSAMAVAASRVEAQRSSEPGTRPVAYLGLGVIGADPVGELGAYFDAGAGMQFIGAFPLEPTGRVRLRGDFGIVIYGNERQQFCMSAPVGCRIELDLNTTNSILFGGLGPEVSLAQGPVEPYLNATFGFTWFGTTSSLQGESGAEDFASTTNFSDAVFAWRAGGGLRVQVGGGRTPVSLDFGVERHENGVADFLTKGDIVDHPDGSITLVPNRAEANLVTFRMGVSVGLPHGSDRDEGGRTGRGGL